MTDSLQIPLSVGIFDNISVFVSDWDKRTPGCIECLTGHPTIPGLRIQTDTVTLTLSAWVQCLLSCT